MDDDEKYPLFKEYPLNSSYPQLIPAKAQRGLSTFDVEFTCLDADGCYLVIGSNVGVAYLVNREKDNLQKLKDNDHKNQISSIKILVSLECLVAVGFRNGAILVYKVPFEENQEVEKFTVEGLHSSAITALEWAKNGMKFFSGDENGIIVCTEIDHFEHQSRSRQLLNEKSKIVQLSYSHFNLVVSTVFRSLIYSLKSKTASQIGQKERKCFGPFGAIIFDEQSGTIFASRPGQRIWKSDFSGIIQETLIFKNALSESCPLIETLTKTDEKVTFNDFQFGQLARFEPYIIIWSDSYVVLIDPYKKLVVAASPKLDPISDVATCKNEIFILRGLRHILRVSSEPDTYNSTTAPTEEPSIIEDILEPLKGLGTLVKERSDSLSVHPESNTNIFDWLKKKRSTSIPANITCDTSEHDGIKTTESLPDIVSLDSNQCIPVRIDDSPASINNIPEFITKDFTNGNENDDLVYKVKKKNKKTKKVQFVIDAAPVRKRFLSSANPEECNKDVPNNEVNSYKISNNVPNLEINPVISDSSSVESISISNDDSHLKTGQNIFETSDKNYEDDDKLLENVLIAYSHSKHKDLPSVDSKDVNSNDLSDINDVNSNDLSDINDINSNDLNDLNGVSTNTNFESNKNISSDVNHDTSNTDIEESVINSDDDNKQNFDNDEIYFPESNSNSERKERSKSEVSMDSLSLDDSSIISTSSKNNDPPKYGVDWVQYKAPELLLDISVSSDHIFCVDVRNDMYFSRHPQMGSLYWIKLEQPAERIATSDLETVVWALYRGTVFAAVHKALCLWENTEWVSIARDVVSIAVDDECGWYTKSNGELITQQNLSLTKPCNYPETVPCDSPALQVAIREGVLWVLTVSGSLLARKSADGKKSKSRWKEIVLKDIPGIDSIYLGYNKTGWITDISGFIHFIINVTPDTPEGTGQPWIVEASNYLFRPSSRANASLEQVVRRTLNSETLTNLIRGKQHLHLSASSVGVWFIKTYDNLLYSNQNSIIGHNWEMVIPPSTAAATKWNLIAADGINNSEGTLWCVNSTGELFCYDIKSKNLLPVESPSASAICCLQPKYQSLWLLSEDGKIHIRRGITPNCLQGMFWQALDLAQFGAKKINHISCSSFVSWACTNNREVLMRLGALNPSSSKLNQAWVPVNIDYEQISSPLDKLSAIGKHLPLPLIPNHCSQDGFSEVYVGPQGYPVWAIDKRCNVYVREGVSTNLPIGKKWTVIPDLPAKQLCISNNAVWLLKASGKIYRRFGVTEQNPCGDYWKQMPGNLDFITITEDDDLWGLQDGSIHCHYSFVLYNTVNSDQEKPIQRLISEEDWEDIMADDFEVL